MLKESDDLDILGVTFDTKMTFEKHLRSVPRSSSFSKAWHLEKVRRVFHDRLLIGRCFRGFVLPVLVFCSVVLGCRYTLTNLLDRVVSSVCF